MTTEFIGVPAIAIICYFIGEIVKKTKIDPKWIPAIVGAVGIAISVIAFLTSVPNYPASDILSAIMIGIASGGASTWAHEAISKFKF